MATSTSESSLLQQFIGTRAEIHRAGSSDPLYGWVRGAQQDQVHIQITDPVEFTVNDEFNIGLSGHHASTLFSTTFLGMSGALYAFQSPQIVRLGNAKPLVRKETSIRTVKLTTSAAKVTAKVLDIARNGFAIQTEISLEQKEKISATFITPDGAELFVKAETVYCRFDQETQQFRIGFEHKELGRVDAARWQKLLSE